MLPAAWVRAEFSDRQFYCPPVPGPPPTTSLGTKPQTLLCIESGDEVVGWYATVSQQQDGCQLAWMDGIM